MFGTNSDRKHSLSKSNQPKDDIVPRLLRFNSKSSTSSKENNDPNIDCPVRTYNQVKKKSKVICTSAKKILDAPGLEDDYYLNLLDWNKKS